MVAGTVIDLDEQLQLREPVADGRQPRRELGVEEDRLGVGVFQQVEQFVLDIAVVDVDRHGARLEHAELGLEVFVGVVAIEANLGVGADPGPPERLGDPRGPVFVLPPCAATSPLTRARLSGTREATVSNTSAKHHFIVLPPRIRVPTAQLARRLCLAGCSHLICCRNRRRTSHDFAGA